MARSRSIDLDPPARPLPDDVVFIHIDYQPAGFMARIRTPSFAITVNPTDGPLQTKAAAISFVRKFFTEARIEGRLVWSFFHDSRTYDDSEV